MFEWKTNQGGENGKKPRLFGEIRKNRMRDD
jgi:hypothetical protein